MRMLITCFMRVIVLLLSLSPLFTFSQSKVGPVLNTSNAKQNQVSSEETNKDDESGKGSMEYVDVKYGFKDIKLEQSISKLQSIVQIKKVESSDGLDYYDVVDPKYKKVGQCVTKRVFFTAFKGQVLDIFIQTSNITNSQCILETLQELFGSGFKSNQYIERYAWFGEKSSVMYDENSVNHSAVISIHSNVVNDSYETYKKSSRNQGAKEF
jgi:hypothetical protein